MSHGVGFSRESHFKMSVQLYVILWAFYLCVYVSRDDQLLLNKQLICVSVGNIKELLFASDGEYFRKPQQIKIKLYPCVLTNLKLSLFYELNFMSKNVFQCFFNILCLR